MRIRDLVQDHLAREHHASAQAHALLTEPISEWAQLIATHDILRTGPALHQVLDRATAELYRDAAVGLSLTETVLLHAQDAIVRGRALRLRATALHHLSRGDEARATLQDAQAVLANHPAGAIELLHARLLGAYLRSETGSEDVLLDVRLIAKEFGAHGHAKGALQARVMEAAILFDREEFLRALRVNHDAFTIAKTLRDETQQAITLYNAGQCAKELSLRARDEGVRLQAHEYANQALALFAQAAPRYAALGMDAERHKIVWAMAGLAAQRGALEEARVQLGRVRAELLSRSMFLAAALVSLDLMELLVMTHRTELALPWLSDTERTLAEAGMPRYALAALERVQEAAREGTIDMPLLTLVRNDVRACFANAA